MGELGMTLVCRQAREMAEVACNKLAFLRPFQEEALTAALPWFFRCSSPPLCREQIPQIAAFEKAAYGDAYPADFETRLTAAFSRGPELFLCALLGNQAAATSTLPTPHGLSLLSSLLVSSSCWLSLAVSRGHLGRVRGQRPPA